MSIRPSAEKYDNHHDGFGGENFTKVIEVLELSSMTDAKNKLFCNYIRFNNNNNNDNNSALHL